MWVVNYTHMTTIIYFVRHGAVENPQQLYYGRLAGFPLSAAGVQQAQQAANFLRGRPLAAIYSSPLLRTRQTAQAIAAAFPGLPVQISASLNEVYSPFDGEPGSHLARRGYDVYSGVEKRFEQPADVLRRVLRFVRRALKRHPNQQVAAVTHMDAIQWLALWVRGAPVAVASRAHFDQFGLPPGFPAPASITMLEADAAESFHCEYYVSPADK